MICEEVRFRFARLSSPRALSRAAPRRPQTPVLTYPARAWQSCSTGGIQAIVGQYSTSSCEWQHIVCHGRQLAEAGGQAVLRTNATPGTAREQAYGHRLLSGSASGWDAAATADAVAARQRVGLPGKEGDARVAIPGRYICCAQRQLKRLHRGPGSPQRVGVPGSQVRGVWGS